MQNEGDKTTPSNMFGYNLYKQAPLRTVKDTRVASYVLEKTSRIAMAVIHSASALGQDSTLRTALERTSIGLITDASEQVYSEASRIKFSHGLATLSSLLIVGKETGMLAEINCSVIAEAINDLTDTCERAGLFSGRVYGVEREELVEMPRGMFRGEPSIKTETQEGRERDDAVRARLRVAPRADTPTYQTATDTAPRGQAPYYDKLQAVQKDRRATILGLLQRKDRITVKDVSNVVKDCSEKTLQRELAALVAQGVLKKEGERRWSTYRLV